MTSKILLLSAYRSDSHAAWADWLQQQPQVDWRVLELPGRYFRWRIRGNPLSWQMPLSEILQHWQPDRVLATSMVDIATLRGICPALASVPVDYYFHENQFAYPVSHQQHSSLDPQMVQIYGALAADRLLFNSHFNRDTFLAGIDQLMAKMPDQKPDALAQMLLPKCQWLPVPVEAIHHDQRSVEGLIVWNHRWEYDKAPQRFVEILRRLKHRGVSFSLALLGHRATRTPEALQTIVAEFADDIVVNGRVSRDEYCSWLGRAQVVVSTADHEFQGISMLEASSAGAVPVVPDDLCYAEQYPDSHRYPPGDIEQAASLIERALAHELSTVDVTPWLASVSAPRWRNLLMNGVSE